MKSNFEKYQIFIYLLLIIFGMLGLRIKYGYQPTGNEVEKTVLQNSSPPPPLPTATPTIDEKKDFPLKSYLPYNGKGYIIEKYSAPMTLQMRLTTADEDKATIDVIKWIDSFGDEMGQHTIELLDPIATPTITPTKTPVKVIIITPTPTSSR